ADEPPPELVERLADHQDLKQRDDADDRQEVDRVSSDLLQKRSELALHGVRPPDMLETAPAATIVVLPRHRKDMGGPGWRICGFSRPPTCRPAPRRRCGGQRFSAGSFRPTSTSCMSSTKTSRATWSLPPAAWRRKRSRARSAS